MKRIIAALAILIIAFGSSVWIYLKIISTVDELTEIAEEIRNTVNERGKTNYIETKRFSDAWDKAENFMVSFLPHSELDDIEIGIKNIANYHGQGLTDEYLEELNNVINRLEHIKESEKPTVKNIF
ncbi:MAG TPA: hypothetical protein DCY31_07815 [Ruminococcaceae bacterium]|nr:hypothetical protein [Oscillospiraceae bacterium]